MEKKAPLNFYYHGYEKCSRSHSFGPAVRAHYLVHFILSGKGVYHVGNRRIHLKKNQGFLIKPKEITYYEADKADPWEYIWLAFDGEEGERILEKHGLSGDSYLCEPENPEKMEAFLRNSLNCFQNPEHARDELTGWFYLFFSCLKNVPSPLPQPRDRELLKAALEYMQNNYMYSVNVNDVSATLGIDRTYLYKLCKKYTRITPKDFLTTQKVRAAKDMLRFSTLNITEIAFSCGFFSSSVFCKMFRKYERTTPLAYRKKYFTLDKRPADSP